MADQTFLCLVTLLHLIGESLDMSHCFDVVFFVPRVLFLQFCHPLVIFSRSSKASDAAAAAAAVLPHDLS